ncbi:MAG: DUF2057 domain-containing protein [Desulfatiglans sp.]|nr:DUF2057 domain-containing protein [Desulfatiglans sp.]
MKYRSLFAVLISIGIFLSFLSCMKRQPIRFYDASEVSPAEAARIRVPADIEVVSVDDHRVKSVADYILSTIEEIHVAPGEREIVVRYIKFWPYDKKKNEEIKSENIALKFIAERGGLYTLIHPELDDIMEAKKFAENPDIRITQIGQSSYKEYKISQPDHKIQIEKSSAMKEDTALKDEWYNLSEEEKEEFRKWLEWNNMSAEEKQKFREWTSKSDKE